MRMTVRHSERMLYLQCIRLHFVVLIPTLTSRQPVRQFFTMQPKPLPSQSSASHSHISQSINGSEAITSDGAANSQFQPIAGLAQGSNYQSVLIPPKVSESKSLAGSQETSFEPQVSHHSRLDAYKVSGKLQPTLASRAFSPLQVYQNHIAAMQQKEGYSCNRGLPLGLCSPIPHRKFGGGVASSGPFSLPEARSLSETRWKSPLGSPLPLRSSCRAEEPEQLSGNTSPIILQRFYHQQKQQQMLKEVEENAKTDPCKRRFASYIKLQLTGDKSGRSSRHQSPEPPPRLNRGQSADGQSPLALRKAFLETHTPNSPSLSRRYVQPTPPVPPPRRLSESTSVPGSPQHLRARFHYTPEPQRRIFQSNDIS